MSTPRPRPKVMSLTDAAAARIKALLADRPNACRAAARREEGGCAGMEYTMSWAETQDRFDEVVEDKGVKILIDPMAVMYLLGTEMDYRVDKLAAQFVFNNPNQQSACGCGESVALTPVSKESLEAIKA